MVLFGLGEAFRSGTHKAIILDYLKRNNLLSIKTRYYGGTRSWSQFGSAVSSLIAMGIVIINQDFKTLFLFTAIPYIINLFNIATYPGETEQKYDTGRKKQIIKTAGRSILANLKEYVTIFKTANNLKSLFSAATYIAVFKTVKDYLQPILETIALAMPVFLSYGADQRTALIVGISFFIIFSLTSLASKNAWRIEDKIRDLAAAINIVYFVGIFSIGISGLFLWMGYPAAAAFLFILLYIAQNIRRPLMVSYISDLISYKIMASGLSTESQLQTLIIVIYAPLFGWLVDFSGLAFALIITSLLFLLIFPLLKITTIDSNK